MGSLKTVVLTAMAVSVVACNQPEATATAGDTKLGVEGAGGSPQAKKGSVGSVQSAPDAGGSPQVKKGSVGSVQSAPDAGDGHADDDTLSNDDTDDDARNDDDWSDDDQSAQADAGKSSSDVKQDDPKKQRERGGVDPDWKPIECKNSDISCGTWEGDVIYCGCDPVNNASLMLLGAEPSAACAVTEAFCAGAVPEYTEPERCVPRPHSPPAEEGQCDVEHYCGPVAQLLVPETGETVAALDVRRDDFGRCYDDGEAALCSCARDNTAEWFLTVLDTGIARACDLAIELCGEEANKVEPEECELSAEIATHNKCQLMYGCQRVELVGGHRVRRHTGTPSAECVLRPDEKWECMCGYFDEEPREPGQAFNLDAPGGIETCWEAFDVCHSDLEAIDRSP